MAGFLDPKQRVMDVILTELGRKQMMKGEFVVKFVSFSDKGVDYRDNGEGVLEPITDRLFFEAFSQRSDEIIPEIDSLGKFIIDQAVPGNLEVRNGVLYEESNTGGMTPVDGYSKVTTFSQNTSDRFSNLEILNTVSSVDEFSVDRKKFTLEVDGLVPSTVPNITPNVDLLVPLSVDPRFENQINMRYLPPVVSTPTGLQDMRS